MKNKKNLNDTLVLGSTGMLGAAIVSYFTNNDVKVTGVARSGADVNFDILDFDKLTILIKRKKPKIIINCIAITDINSCEKNLDNAYLINSHLVAVLVDVCRNLGIYLVHISTDHFYINDTDKIHHENSPVVLINNYAKTKFAGEKFACSYSKSLVIRTNIVGFRNSKAHTFVEWILSSLKNRDDIVLFQDFYTSSIDVYNFSKILFEVINNRKKPIYGLVNISSSEVCSKEVFIKKIASVFNYRNNNFKIGSVTSIGGTRRAESLGLNVSKIERLLGIKMPTTDQVIDSLYNNWENNV